MIQSVLNSYNWLPHYCSRFLKRRVFGKHLKPKHIYLCICDHFEPYWGKAEKQTACKRLQKWLDEYPKIAEQYRDADGELLKYSFFYPEEEYQKDDLNALAELCHAGYGEVEVHLHHNNDTSSNLRQTLLDYKKRLHEEHGLLSVDRKTGMVSYGFIHGNWALDNSRPDGRWCGVNDELTVLLDTGCYADFTMPSAPSDTQTRKTNSIYYAVDNPHQPKSHDSGVQAAVGHKRDGLLLVQGPLGLNWRHRKFGLLPRIENGGLLASNPINRERIRIWCAQEIHIKGAEQHIFIKIYTHGAQERNMEMFFQKKGLSTLLMLLGEFAAEIKASLHFVSARQMVNIIHALESGCASESRGMREWRYQAVSETGSATRGK